MGNQYQEIRNSAQHLDIKQTLFYSSWVKGVTEATVKTQCPSQAAQPPVQALLRWGRQEALLPGPPTPRAVPCPRPSPQMLFPGRGPCGGPAGTQASVRPLRCSGLGPRLSDWRLVRLSRFACSISGRAAFLHI